jgi:hypothetical protein
MDGPTINALELDRLFKDWEVKPPIFAKNAKKTFVLESELRFRSQEKSGYPAPRSILPIPDGFTLRKADLVAEVEKLNLKKIVIVYPTQFYNLERCRFLTKNYPETYSDMHWAAIHEFFDTDRLNAIMNKATGKGIVVEFLPMVKLAKGSSNMGNPVRFWTPTKPQPEAAYVLCDDIMGEGKTYAAMLSHLTAYGVPGEHMIGSLNGEKEPLTLRQEQKQGIAWLRNNHPDTAARADIILDLIGIGGMDGLTSMQAKRYGISSATPSPEKVDDSMKELTESIRKTKPRVESDSATWWGYHPVAEMKGSFIKRVSKLGFPPSSPQR